MSAYVTKPISTCERVSRALSALLSELHFPTRALGPITEARDLLLRAALDANEFYSTERDELTRDVVKLRADLAAAVAERDEACTAYQVRSAEWHQYELIALALAERYKLRAEQAEARLSAIDSAPVVAVVREMKRDFASGPYKFLYYDSDKLPAGGTELIAKPAKD